MAKNFPLFLLPLVFHLIAAFSIPSEARCMENHRHALLQLKGGLRYSDYLLPSWTNATDSDCCVGWYGVTCDPPSAGEVTSLDLSSLKIQGMVDPDALFSLANLTTLNLAFNYLNFSEVVSSPRAFEKLQRLKVLNLSNSGFQGQIPMGISTLTNLVSLDFSINPDNSFPSIPSCRIPRHDPEVFLKYPNVTRLTRDMKSLEALYLDMVDLSSDGIDWMDALSSESHSRLAELSLRACSLSGSAYHSIAKLGSLTVLRLDGNNLTSVDSGFLRNLSSLQILGLRDCALTGSIPEGLFLLKNLTRLDMSCNSLFGGSLPEMIRGLVSLESLRLSNCNLSGSIPSSLFNLPSLKTLELQRNRLSGNLGELSDATAPLETVDLSSNSLSGKVQLNLLLVGLQNLSILDLSYNRLTVMGPESSDAARRNSALPKMSKLKLVSCNINNFPLFLKEQAKLEHLDLSLNRIAGNIPSWLLTIGSTNSLKYLNLSHNILTGFEEPLFDLLNTSSLRYIDLSSNRLKGSFLLPPPGNIFVDYSNNYLSSEIPENISRYLEGTDYFLISNNNLSGKILPKFCASQMLTLLDVSLNNFSGPIPPCLGQLPYLTALNLRGNRFGDKIPSNLFNTRCPFRALNLNSNRLSGNVPVSLRNCQNLFFLDLGNNRLDGEFPGWLGNLTDLNVLVLRSNRLSGHVDAPNGSFKHLKIVDLSSNNFNGRLPLQLFLNMKRMMIAKQSPTRSGLPSQLTWSYYSGGLHLFTIYWPVTVISKRVERTLEKIWPAYQSIDASNNRFEGSIPDEIGMLNAVTFLNTSHNFLSGVIPTSMGNLTQLQELDLSNNQLSGQIPRELVRLSFLSFLNLSYNNLSGAIPEGRQFNTFENNSYFGNSGLCGYPSGNSCSDSTASNRGTLPSHHENKPDWEFFFLFGGLGFGWGFVLVIASLLLCRRWGELFNTWVDSTLFPLGRSLWRNCTRPLEGQRERAE